MKRGEVRRRITRYMGARWPTCRVPTEPGRVCAEVARWVVWYPGRYRKDGRRARCQAPRCSTHAAVFAERHGVVGPKGLVEWIERRRGRVVLARGGVEQAVVRAWERWPAPRPNRDRLVGLVVEELGRVVVLE